MKKYIEYLNLIMIGGILLFLVFQSFQINSLKSEIGLVIEVATASAGKNLDTTGWTANEKMMYEHHGTIPTKLGGSTAPQSTGMVGGC